MAKKQTRDEETATPTEKTITKVAVDHGTHDGEPPILIGREGDTFRTVTLEGGGNGAGQYRVAEPLPQSLVAMGSRYMRSTEDTYVWQVP
jgi:hypothetical protein